MDGVIIWIVHLNTTRAVTGNRTAPGRRWMVHPYDGDREGAGAAGLVSAAVAGCALHRNIRGTRAELSARRRAPRQGSGIAVVRSRNRVTHPHRLVLGLAPVNVGGHTRRTSQGGRSLIEPVDDPLLPFCGVPAAVRGPPGPRDGVDLPSTVSVSS